ncbi:restriction endonuclease subunit S [Segatella bryantii]|uniref:Type I restriction modification DNA specificity domain-containing protein n=1 Tax=Segatella bryantii TaxID=77095 RepID=A0ABX4EH24_SEGBR|nr:restriction endonuclease subunit S [Segatella bryantii]OYP55245.1 hypothetical protein CIK91_06925 [Segatella bryantii]UKK82488.1 restriction endonuclease subunit S [Segatella bryantii]
MSEWKKVKLGDILQVKKGDYITKKEAREGIYPVILGGKEPAYFIDKYNHTGKAIVISRSGASAGYVSFWNEPIFVTDGFLIEPKGGMTYEFLYYALKSKQAILHKAQKGAAIPHVTPLLIGNIDFLLPNKDVQHRIATILSRYDSLIENYQKQIKLLEEAAQRLYKEWFIDLHFPGHENTKIVDGVPEGWEKKKVGELGKVITGKTPSTAKKEYYGGQIPFITIPDMHTGIYPTSSQFLSSLGANSQSGKFIPANSLMVSCIGTAGLVCITKEECQTNQQINSLVLNDNYLLYYMYNTFLSLKGHLNNIGSNGATMTNVSKSKFESIEILIPTNSISNLYNKAVEQSFRSIENLSSQIRLLTEARDRLLPKLMNGEIKA